MLEKPRTKTRDLNDIRRVLCENAACATLRCDKCSFDVDNWETMTTKHKKELVGERLMQLIELIPEEE